MEFTTQHAEPSINSTTATVLFADHEINADMPHVHLFPHANKFKDNNDYFEVNDQPNSSDGGPKSVRVPQDSIEVRLKRETTEKFGDGEFARILVDFDDYDKPNRALLGTLWRIFEGSGLYQETQREY